MKKLGAEAPERGDAVFNAVLVSSQHVHGVEAQVHEVSVSYLVPVERDRVWIPVLREREHRLFAVQCSAAEAKDMPSRQHDAARSSPVDVPRVRPNPASGLPQDQRGVEVDEDQAIALRWLDLLHKSNHARRTSI